MSYSNSTPVLSNEILYQIMEFLPFSDLWNMSQTSKIIQNLVTISMVVKACLLKGGYAKVSMEKIYPLIKNRSIYPPSVRRLFTIARGKVCEICLNEKKYKKGNSCIGTRVGFGINACWRCVTKRRYSKRIMKSGDTFQRHPIPYHMILNNRRTAAKKYGYRDAPTPTGTGGIHDDDLQMQMATENGIETRMIYRDGIFIRQFGDMINYLWAKPYYDRHGERAGPIVTAEDFVGLLNEVKNHHTLDDMSNGYEKYLSVKLNAPHPDNKRYVDFESSFEATIQRANQVLKQRQCEKEMASYIWRQKKLGLAMELIKKMKTEINNPKNLALLNFTTNLDYICKRKKTKGLRQKNPIIMNKRWINTLLYGVIRSPSLQSRVQIKKVVTIIEALADEEHSDIEQDELQTHQLEHRILLHSFEPASSSSQHRARNRRRRRAF